MRRFLLFVVVVCWAQKPGPPFIGETGIYQAGSERPPLLPGGEVSPGALIWIEAIRAGQNPGIWLRTARGERQLRIDKVEEERFLLRLPIDIPLGKASAQIRINGGASPWRDFTIAPNRLAVFPQSTPVIPGRSLRAKVSGWDGKKKISAMIGNARVSATGKASGELYEIEVTVPKETPLGCHVAMMVEAGGPWSNSLPLRVAPEGETCERYESPLTRAFSQPGRRGGILLMRNRVLYSLPGADSAEERNEYVWDSALAAFFYGGAQQSGGLPAAGTCTTVAMPNAGPSITGEEDPIKSGGAAKMFGSLSRPGEERATFLAAGEAMEIEAGTQHRTVTREVSDPWQFNGILGGKAPETMRRGGELFLTSPEFALKIPAGKDLGAIATRGKMPAPIEWIASSQLGKVGRKRGFAVAWKADPGQRVLVVALSVEPRSGAAALTACAATQGASNLSIAPEWLMHLPRYKRQEGLDSALISFVALLSITHDPEMSRFAAEGLDRGYVVTGNLLAQSVYFY